MGWFNKCFEKFKTQGKGVIIALIFAKFLFKKNEARAKISKIF